VNLVLIQHILLRDLQSLRDELLAYPNERAIWQVPQGIANSAGSLALHLAGNLQHFVGAQLGGTGYLRNRPAEFTRRDVPRAELLVEIEAAEAAVKKGLAATREDDLPQPYPLEVGGAHPATGSFLVHLTTHLAYHLGQVDYHRRLVTGEPHTVGALTIPQR